MYRTYTFRVMPNATQRAALENILADNCETYNAALQERNEAWKLQRKRITTFDQFKEITQLRKDKRFAVVAAIVQRDPILRLERAFRAFFRRYKAGEKPGYPRFKSKKRYNSFSFGNNQLVVRERSILIPKLGDVRVRGGRPISGSPKLCHIKRLGNKWIAVVVCIVGQAPPKIAISNAVGIDLGLTTFATLSDKTEIANPRFGRKHAQAIARASRALSRKKRGSKNRIKAKEVLRRAHQRAADARSNFTHHVSKQLVQTYDLIAHEDLKIANMARSTLAKSINDAAWGQFVRKLTYKAESAGKWVIPVNPRGTSQKCSGCGAVVKKKLSERQHICGNCSLELGRDHNAAINILALGQSAVEILAESIQAIGSI